MDPVSAPLYAETVIMDRKAENGKSGVDGMEDRKPGVVLSVNPGLADAPLDPR